MENGWLLSYNLEESSSEVPAKSIPLIGEKIAYLDSWNDHHQCDLKFKNIKIKLFQNQ